MTILPQKIEQQLSLDPQDRQDLGNGLKNIVPHLIKLSVITSFLFTAIHPVIASPISPQAIVSEVNTIRQDNNLPALQENHLLTLAAHKKATDLYEKDYFAHQTPDGKDFYEWIDEAGYQFTFAGENLAKDFNTTDAVMVAWMNSPTHRQNILDSDFCEIGITTIELPNNTSLIVQMFGCRQGFIAQSTADTAGYTLSAPESDTSLTAYTGQQQNPLIADPENVTTQEKNRLLAGGLVLLSTVLVLTVGQHRKTFHHIYKIPITIHSKREEEDESSES